MWKMSLPPPPQFMRASLPTKICIWCRVLELISPFYGMYIDKTVKYYTTHLMLTAQLL